MIEFDRLYCGDCFTIMEQMCNDGIKADAVITDLPYGTTPIHWDSVLPVEQMWSHIHSVVNDDTPILLFGQEPFSSFLRTSNIKEYRYDWYWQKERLTNVFQIKRRPGKVIENIMVFYKKQCKYNPQKTIHDGKPVTNKIGETARFSLTQDANNSMRPTEYIDDGTRFPLQLLRFNRVCRHGKNFHPTEKPVDLMRYLVRTYTNENDLVLDFTMGSGSTCVACVLENRRFIGIDNNQEYVDIAQKRIKENDTGRKRIIDKRFMQ